MAGRIESAAVCIAAAAGVAGLCLCTRNASEEPLAPAGNFTRHAATIPSPQRAADAPLIADHRPTSSMDDPTSSTDDLLRAQALVERLRPVALAFQEAIVRSKSESHRQLDADDGAIGAYVRQHAAHVRNRDATLRLLRGLRVVMDMMLGAGVPSDDDSWSDSDSDSDAEADAPSRAATRFRAIEREASMLEKRAQRLPEGSAVVSVHGHVPTVESRQQLLQGEAAALHAATLDPPIGSSAARMEALAAVVVALRAAETSFDFQRTLMQAHQKLGSTTDYSRDNFAYGSTPWQSWIQLHTDPGCQELSLAVQRCTAVESSLPEYIVFGSSLGWLCFYAALSLSVRVIGYEIVEPLVTKAKQLRAQHCSAGDAACSIEFHCQDMLTAPLERCGVLLLTSRCWDKPLASALHTRCATIAKLCVTRLSRRLQQHLDHVTRRAEAPSSHMISPSACLAWLHRHMAALIHDLPDESIVVDYNDDLVKAVPDSTTQREAFEVVGSCVVPVSWDSQQHMYVMKRRRL